MHTNIKNSLNALLKGGTNERQKQYASETESKPTMRTDVPAEVAAVLEDLTADTALIDTFVLPELFYQLPPYTMSTGEN